MAKMYRETVTSTNKTLAASPIGLIEHCFTISPIDADQIPNRYCKSIKVSVSPQDNTDSERSFIVAASTDDTPTNTSDWITAQATSRGGGTVWLNLKRPVKSSAEEPNRPDGEIYVHVLTNAGGLSIETNLVAEVWGRFLNMAAV